jgi:hypothetical protein
MDKLIEYADNVDIWDLQPGEPSIWHERFEYYRLMGPLRTIGKAYRRYRKDIDNVETTASATHYWREKAAQWKWEERAQAWDATVQEEKEERALSVFSEGLSLSHERVAKLKLIAQKLEEYILDPRTTRVSPHIIEQYRGLLDDIAKERGERSNKVSISGPSGGPIVIETQWGRGGSASEAWKSLPSPVIDSVVEEITDTENGSKAD